jgi:hypothetical protein
VKNKITSLKEIQWKEVLKIYPWETRESLTRPVASIYHRCKNSPLDYLYLVFQDNVYNNYKEKDPSEKNEYQSTIVEIYLNCKR